MSPSNRETLVFNSAARIRAQRATSSLTVMVTFFMTRISCNTNFVSNRWNLVVPEYVLHRDWEEAA